MAGHSKWAQIKHKKAKEDAKKGKIFSKLTRAIIVAVKQEGAIPKPTLNLPTQLKRQRNTTFLKKTSKGR